jgi:large subunit ribosomal protein L29
METKELRGFTLEDLKKTVKEKTEELFNTRLQNISGSLENTAKIKEVRRGIARVKTVINEKLSR